MTLPANWTTIVPAERSVQEIMGLLATHGAQKVLTEYGKGTGDVLAISFIVQGPDGREMPFRLPANAEAAHRVFLRERHKRTRGVTLAMVSEAHARNVAWRLCKDWLRAQLSLVELEQVSLETIMLPYLLVGENKPLHQALWEGGLKALLPPPSEVS